MKPAGERYRTIVCDGERWNGFEFRDGDIVITTPPKCGTTWTQTICALLIFKTVDLPKPVDMLSPWLDQTLRPLDEVFADLRAQDHRRFIKSHLPLDGLPFDEKVDYICVGRDPRDVAMSWDNHIENLNFEAVFALREKAVGTEDLAELLASIAMPLPTERERFWQWVDDSTPLTESLGGLHFLVHHIASFWEVRHLPNVTMLHYGELKADLVGQMRALAERLGIDLPDALVPQLAEAATFESMKKRAAEAAPNASEPIWKDTGRFFHRGTNGQWRDLLDGDDLGRYEKRVTALAPADLSDWLHQGPIA